MMQPQFQMRATQSSLWRVTDTVYPSRFGPRGKFRP